MMSGRIANDAMGNACLFLKGDWSAEVELLLQEGDWNLLVLLGVDWSDYRNLVPYAGRIKMIRIPFGPDSSSGFSELTNLSRIESTDVFKPPVDFRTFHDLDHLEAIWEKRRADFFASQRVSELILHGVAGDDLRWIPETNRLKKIRFLGGRLKSLSGIERAFGLSELRASDLKCCIDICAVKDMSNLEILDLDAPKTFLDDLNWVRKMPKLAVLRLSCQLGSVDWELLGQLSAIRSITITTHEGYLETDDEIKRRVQRGGRRVVAFQRFPSKVPGYTLELSQ